MDQKIIEFVRTTSYDPAVLLAFIEVETGGHGFDPSTGKIMIQFEPSWFRTEAPYAPMGEWSHNGVELQPREWIAFNDAFRKDPKAAMLSTSIGLGQILGLHYARLGFATVDDMWNDAKQGIESQVSQMIRFLESDPHLQTALTQKDWQTVASIYNGKAYRALAEKYGREPYDISLAKAYQKYSQSNH